MPLVLSRKREVPVQTPSEGVPVLPICWAVSRIVRGNDDDLRGLLMPAPKIHHRRSVHALETACGRRASKVKSHVLPSQVTCQVCLSTIEWYPEESAHADVD